MRIYRRMRVLLTMGKVSIPELQTCCLSPLRFVTPVAFYPCFSFPFKMEGI